MIAIDCGYRSDAEQDGLHAHRDGVGHARGWQSKQTAQVEASSLLLLPLGTLRARGVEEGVQCIE